MNVGLIPARPRGTDMAPPARLGRLPSRASDNELVSRCRSGDVDAFGQLYERYHRLVYHVAHGMVGDPEDAEDILQLTFLKAHRSITTFRGDASFSSWLLKITTNLCRDHHKARARRNDVPLAPEFAASLQDCSVRGQDPAALLDRTELHRLVRQVLAGLPERHREIVILRDVQEMSYAQIAEIIGCTPSSVKLRLFRARCNLRKRVDSLLNGR